MHASDWLLSGSYRVIPRSVSRAQSGTPLHNPFARLNAAAHLSILNKDVSEILVGKPAIYLSIRTLFELNLFVHRIQMLSSIPTFRGPLFVTTGK